MLIRITPKYGDTRPRLVNINRVREIVTVQSGSLVRLDKDVEIPIVETVDEIERYIRKCH